MNSNFVRQNIFPTLAAFIWGTAFVAQSVASEHVQPFTFNASRSIIAFVFLLALAFGLHIYRRSKGEDITRGAAYWRDLLIGGLFCGLALFFATNLQQKGIETTTSGKAGFITALYIVIVPICGLFLRKKVSGLVWFSVALAVGGLYFLCINESMTISSGDFYILLCAFCFAGHILVIDHFTQKVDGVELSCAQFLVGTLLSGTAMLAFETPEWATVSLALGEILYVGIFSSGVAYTLQILAQKGSNPTTVSLLMSLEAVFATLGGAIILNDQMTGREYFGCALMMLAVILAQIPDFSLKNFRAKSAKTKLPKQSY